MNIKDYKPNHISATWEDLAGNNGIGRYVFLPGSDGRALEISKHFSNCKMSKHPRGHHLYTGTLECNGHTIDVASIASGMGCPSMEIILHELFHLGAKRFLRIGTAGSLQKAIKPGHIVSAQASVRDESTTVNYLPLEIPAVASLEFASAILLSAEKIGLSHLLHTGVVHCKSSLYAREFSAGPQSKQNHDYLELLCQAGVLASEMETATLFIQTQLYNHQLVLLGESPKNRVLAGAILAIVPNIEEPTKKAAIKNNVIHESIDLALETIKTLAVEELFD